MGGEGVMYSRSSSSRVTAFDPGGSDGEPIACVIHTKIY